MRVLVIDPWGVKASANYLNGLLMGLSEYADVSLITNYHYKEVDYVHPYVKRFFFKKSEIMKRSIFRNLVRGLEYVIGYYRILRFLKSNNTFDVIHINWMLFYRFDAFIIKKLHKYCRKIVYTAHNVIPHIDGENSIRQLDIIYGEVDRIILHGYGIKREFERYFAKYAEKVFVHFHGAYFGSNTLYNEGCVPDNIKETLGNYKYVYLFLGNIFYNKGIDRVIPIWEDMPKDALLVIAGKMTDGCEELMSNYTKSASKDRILMLNHYVSDDIANYLVDHSDILLLPYRHASMSGVVYTAADFAKPVWFTDVGAIKECLNDKISIMSANDDNAIADSIKDIERRYSKEDLAKMGIELKKHIREVCDWKKIAKRLVEECYQ